jgi:hypothetical protein
MALLGVVVIVGLVVFAVVRLRHRREAAEAETMDPTRVDGAEPEERRTDDA